MRISEIYARPGPVISFEFFPPKSEEAEAALFRDTVPALQRLNPAFISVTYGAGGGTRVNTLRIVHRLRAEYGIEAMHHVTCVGSTRETLAAVLGECRKLGVHNILALRGDPPKGQAEFQAVEGGFGYAVDLIRFVKELDGFTVGAAGYPEGHVECKDKHLDWDRTAAKVAAGAEFLITQLFYDIRDFVEFESYLRDRHRIRVPVVPGIMPFLSAAQIRRITSMCGSKLPADLLACLETLGDDDEAVRRFGVDYCTRLCRQLLDHGVPGIHFYCLNRAPSCTELLQNLGLVK